MTETDIEVDDASAPGSGTTGWPAGVVRHALPWTLALLGLWVLLAWFRPGTTWHLAPVLAVAAGPVVLRLHRGPAPLGVAAGVAGGVAGCALVVTGVLDVTGLLQGPALVAGSAAGEAVLLIVATALWAAWTVGRARPGILLRALAEPPPAASSTEPTDQSTPR